MHVIKIFVLVSFLQRDTQEEKESFQGLGVWALHATVRGKEQIANQFVQRSHFSGKTLGKNIGVSNDYLGEVEFEWSLSFPLVIFKNF